MLNVPVTVLSFKIVIKLPVHLFPHPLNVLIIFYLMILPPGTLQVIIVRSRNKPSGFLEWRGKQSCWNRPKHLVFTARPALPNVWPESTLRVHHGDSRPRPACPGPPGGGSTCSRPRAPCTPQGEHGSSPGGTGPPAPSGFVATSQHQVTRHVRAEGSLRRWSKYWSQPQI